jgi:hypothetical protein
MGFKNLEDLHIDSDQIVPQGVTVSAMVYDSVKKQATDDRKKIDAELRKEEVFIVCRFSLLHLNRSDVPNERDSLLSPWG